MDRPPSPDGIDDAGMNTKRIIPLALALVLGLISARMVVKIIQSKSVAQAANGPKLVKVVVAARDLPAGEDLTNDDVTAGEIVADSAPGTTFADPGELVGRVPAAPLVKGQAILESLLAPKGSGSGLQALIPTGMRAVTIEVNEFSGVAGYITPGCRVDIVQPLHDTSSNETVDRSIAQDVLVTAVGTRPVLGQDPQAGHSVTLLVTPRQGQLIDLATSNGRPRLLLRNARDAGRDEPPGVALSDLMGRIEKTTPSPEAEKAMAPTPGVDPFAPATQPSVATHDRWKIRVITAGTPSVVDLSLPHVQAPSTVTDTKDIKDP